MSITILRSRLTINLITQQFPKVNSRTYFPSHYTRDLKLDQFDKLPRYLPNNFLSVEQTQFFRDT